MTVRIDRGGNPLYPLPADYLTLTPEEMRVWIEGANKVFSLDTIYSVFQAAGKLPEDFDAEQEKLNIEADTANIGGQLIDAFNRGQAG